ncbi:MAG TPA: response regulator [Chloroflexota bacterium]|nr:response regulator [Chloroflexota bacterium]
MSGDQALQTLTQLVFVLIFILTLVDAIRRRDRARWEIAALFGSLALIIVIQGVSQLTGISLPVASLIGTLALLVMPYLLVRLVAHFRTVRPVQHVIGIGYIVLSWGIMVGAFAAGQTAQLPPPLTLALVLPFGYLECYAALAFVQSARATRGVTQKRLIAAAAGSGFFGVLILAAGVLAFFGAPSNEVKVVMDVFTLASAVSYYVGFAPPRWLRRLWQVQELEMFLSELVGRSAEERFMTALDRLGPAATRALGGVGALVALGSETSDHLIVRPDSTNQDVLKRMDVESLPMDGSGPLILRAWHERHNIASSSPENWGPELRRLSAAYGNARSVLVSPLATQGHLHGLLVVFFATRSLFFESKLLLDAMAEQAALAIVETQMVARLREQNSALEAASRLKSEFLANMSHELRTPLNAILGFSELLIDAPPDDDDFETRAVYLERIHESGKHLLSLINDILDLAKIEAGRMELHPEPVPVREMVGQVVGTVQPLADRKGIRLEAQVEEAGELFADEGKLKQILYNLLSNAIKFTPEGGQVSVEAVDLPETGELRLSVVDTGIGIAPEDQERVFQEFQQVDAGANRKYEGTGLGLALTKRFVELHGGRIWLESEPGAGSRFHVQLPRGEAAPARPEAPEKLLAPVTENGSGPLVLVVEDDAAAAHLLSVYLTRAGYQVAAAADGSQAIERARSLNPAAITLDVMLPEVDGWQVLRALKSDAATRDIPVIVTSIVDDQPLGYALGATDYLVKPIEREALLAKLARYTLGPDGSHRPASVLAVDDDPSALALVAGILEPASFNIATASGGAEAIQAVRQSSPDAILLDLMMPEVSGFEVVAALRTDPATQDIPIIIITAKELTAAERASLNGQVSAVFQKGDLRAADLRSAVAAALRSRKETDLSGVHA